jgi:hypothetical protein
MMWRQARSSTKVMGRGDHMIPETVPVSSLTASSGHNDTSAGPCLSGGDIADGVDAQLATSTLLMPPVTLPPGSDRHFHNTANFWRALLSERVRARRTVVLHDVLLSEWFPRSPGLFHTEYAAHARRAAQGHIMQLADEQERALYGTRLHPSPVVYDLYGKREMLRGGIGCIRLSRRQTPDGPLWFMSASTSGSAEEGVPVALTDADYERYIDAITEHGALPCTITGKLTVLPDSLLSLYQDYIGVPRLYVLVEEVSLGRSITPLQQGHPIASATVIFATDEPWPQVCATFVYFIPGGNGTVTQSVPWLEYYVHELHGGKVITDFDEQVTRFPHAVFSLQKIANGDLREAELRDVAQYLHVTPDEIRRLLSQQQELRFTVNRYHVNVGEVHVGDYIHAGAGAVVVNRSTLTNALNTIQANHGDEAARAVQQLAEAVEKSGNQEAVDDLNGLTEELGRSEPRKNRVKVWLDAISSVLPNVVQVTSSVAKIAELLTY